MKNVDNNKKYILDSKKKLHQYELFKTTIVLIVHSKITFSIARNVIMIGLLALRGDVVITLPRRSFQKIS